MSQSPPPLWDLFKEWFAEDEGEGDGSPDAPPPKNPVLTLVGLLVACVVSPLHPYVIGLGAACYAVGLAIMLRTWWVKATHKTPEVYEDDLNVFPFYLTASTNVIVVVVVLSVWAGFAASRGFEISPTLILLGLSLAGFVVSIAADRVVHVVLKKGNAAAASTGTGEANRRLLYLHGATGVAVAFALVLCG